MSRSRLIATLTRAALACACVGLAACVRPTTQLVAVVDSDLGDEPRCLRVESGPVAEGGFEARRVDVIRLGGADMLTIPLSFGVTPPDGDPSARVEIVTSAYADCGRADEGDPTGVLVSRRVRTGFLRGQTLRLPVFLGTRCRAPACDDDGDGVEDEGRSCDPDTGLCADVGYVDPSTLERVEPGSEIAGSRDAGPTRADAGPVDAFDPVDAGPPITGFGTRPIAPTGLAPRADTGRASRVYPVGPAGVDGVIVGGTTDESVMIGDATLPGDAFFVARVAASGDTSWTATSSPAPFRATVESAVTIGADVLVCTTLQGGSITMDGVTVTVASAAGVALLRFDAATGTLEAGRAIELNGASTFGFVRCGGIAEVGGTPRVTLYGTQNGGGSTWMGLLVDRVDATLTGSVAASADRASVSFEIDDFAGAMTLARGVIVATNTTSIASDGAGGAYYVADTGTFDLAGLAGASSSFGTVVIQRVDSSGASRWAMPMRITGPTSGYLSAQIATAGDEAWVWALAQATSASTRISVPGSGGTISRMGASGSTLVVAGRLDPAAGVVVGDVVDLPSGATGIAVDPVGNAYVAGHLAAGETPPIAMTTPVVGSEDPFLASFGPDRALRGVWQWSDGSEDEWGFRRVLWVNGALVVNGYIHEGGLSSVDDESFLWFLPLSSP